MKENIILCDWDNSVRKNFMLTEWLEKLTKEKIIEEKYKKEIEKIFDNYYKGKLKYHELEKINELYSKSLKDIEVNLIKQKAKEFVKQDNKLFNFAKFLFNDAKEKGFKIVILSGAPTELLEAYSKKYGFHEIYGLKLEIKNNKFTGKMLFNTAGYEGKLHIVNQLKNKYNIIAGIGDSTADLPILENAKIPVIVKNEKLRINHNGRRIIYIIDPDICHNKSLITSLKEDLMNLSH
jgi:HAD superfamily phosphoserine phosphatase-like hydrolase